MAFENGDEVVNYIGEVIERYRRDPLVFTKAMQLIPVFMARPDWPHSFDDLDKAAEHILGQPLSSIVFGFTERYIDSEEMIWPDDEPEGFREALRAFHIAVSPIVNQFWMTARSEPMRLFSVASTRADRITYSGTDPMAVVRFIRADGASLEVLMDRHDIQNVVRTLLATIGDGEKDGQDSASAPA